MSNYPGHFATTRPDHPAYVMASTDRAVTYKELDDRANQVSQLIRAAGVQEGEHVAFCLENHVDFYPIAWGCAYAGVYWTAMSSRLTHEEMEYILDDCGAKVFITSAYKEDAARTLLGRNPGITHRYILDMDLEGYERLEDAIAAQPAEPLPDPRCEGPDMLYSSGTTGRPKGVKIPLPGTELGTPTALAGVAQLLFGFDEDAVYLSPAPLYHAAPLRFSMGVHRVGGTVVVMDRFDPELALRNIERYRVTTSQWVPTMFVRMLKLPQEIRDRYDVSSLKVAIHAAAPCPVPVKEQMIEWWGPVLHEYYAGTEGNGFVYTNSEDWLAHRGSVGKALTGTIHILDENGDEVPVGSEGTVYFESEASFEYHNDPDKTRDSRDPKGRGWSTLGDIGKLDEDGFLYLTDRKAYMIITGGVNVYPQEAENVLTMHPAVLDVAVIGVPNEDFGEEVKAVVQPAEGHAGTPELASELIAYCREHLADVKCPRSVDFRDELPRHPTGKLYKRLLRDEYWAGHDSRLV
ncbi:AMP-binding protein [Actinomarinicola tropica]|uniref:AMP-binding protein n=1 Tax=Actinomarinicola tropica TaxID=2789776 RepID=A0A5Q2RL93_9ACTN|nr:AMP-binding protein [Actinomarinicola tropica]QGG95341.1 AMP-binding protein [Actinomarinicola tropica]